MPLTSPSKRVNVLQLRLSILFRNLPDQQLPVSAPTLLSDSAERKNSVPEGQLNCWTTGSMVFWVR
jgi:hypothetical protein